VKSKKCKVTRCHKRITDKMDFPPRRKLVETRCRKRNVGDNVILKHGTRLTRRQLRFNILACAALGLLCSLDYSSFTALALIQSGAVMQKTYKTRCDPQNFPNASTFICKKSTMVRRPVNTLPAQYSTSRLYMSSLGREPKHNEANQKIRLPPPPEDQLNLSGDVAFIFFYSFLDHMVSNMYDSIIKSPAIVSAGSALTVIESSSAASAEYTGFESAVDSLPVWFDTLNSAPFGIVPLSAALPIEQHIAYAPAIDTAGLAAVLLTSTWLFCGYFTGAFQFKNTLQCSTRHAINITAKTCFFTSILMVSLALGSDHFVGCIDCLHKSVGLTKADLAYIFDSLSVLLLWRFVTSTVLGYSEGSDN